MDSLGGFLSSYNTFFGETMFSKVVQRKIAAAMLHDLIIGKSLVTRVLFSEAKRWQIHLVKW